jgi:hypothetical protein
MVPNPKRALWEERRIAAEADRVARQVQQDADFALAYSKYESDLAEWQSLRKNRSRAAR